MPSFPSPQPSGRTVLITSLHRAAAQGHEEVAALLLAHGADPNARHVWCGTTPLHEAAWHGHAGVAAMLLNQGADPKARNNDGWTPAQVAHSRKHEDLARLLFARE